MIRCRLKYIGGIPLAMDLKKLENLKVDSKTEIKGGNFNKVIITGSAVLNGNIICKNFLLKGTCNANGDIESKNMLLNGKASIKGNVKTQKAKLQGLAAIKGNVEVEDLIIAGKVAIEKNLDCGELSIPGVASIEGNIKSEVIYISGASHIKKDIIAESFVLSGGMVHEGCIEAKDVSITLGTESKLNNVKCKSIKIKRPENTAKLFSKLIKKMIKNEVKIKCSKIEGEKIYLENTEADLVRGKIIIIGEGCNVKKVEYSDEFRIVENGKVVNYVKI